MIVPASQCVGKGSSAMTGASRATVLGHKVAALGSVSSWYATLKFHIHTTIILHHCWLHFCCDSSALVFLPVPAWPLTLWIANAMTTSERKSCDQLLLQMCVQTLKRKMVGGRKALRPISDCFSQGSLAYAHQIVQDQRKIGVPEWRTRDNWCFKYLL